MGETVSYIYRGRALRMAFRITMLIATVSLLLIQVPVQAMDSQDKQQPSAQSIQPNEGKNLKPVIIGFHRGKHDPTIVKKVGGKIKADYAPFIEAVAASLPEKAIDALSKNPNIKYVVEDRIYLLEGYVDSPNIVEYQNSWGVDHINADRVHLWCLDSNHCVDNSRYNKGTGVKVAVLDSGIDYNNPELNASYKGGYDFVYNDADPMDDSYFSHGTRVAGIIAAVRNDKNVVGVAPSVDLYALKVCIYNGQCFGSNIISGLKWATDNGMQIASMSFGQNNVDSGVMEAVQSAYNKGLLMIAGSGNDNVNGVYYPAAFDEVIAVGATDKDDMRASFSNYGDALDIVAPGDLIKSTISWTEPQGGTIESGTSFATPHVTGVAALIMSNGIATTNTAVRDVLIRTADDLGPIGRDNEYGYGLVDADGAVGVPSDYETALELHPVPDIGFEVYPTPHYAPFPVIAGKVVTIKGYLLSNRDRIDPNTGLPIHCSVPCNPVIGKTITFTGTSTVPPPTRTEPIVTFGSSDTFSVTFLAPTTAGTWDIQAHFIEDTPYGASDSPVINYVTFVDNDNDGIINDIDTNPNTPSENFSDKGLGGKTDGTIISRGDQILSIFEEPNPKGIRVISDSGGGINPATIRIVCPGVTAKIYSIGIDTNQVYSCGSATIEAISGPPTGVEFFTDGATSPFASVSNLLQGNTVTFDPITSTIITPSSNSNTLTAVLRGGQQLSLFPGQSVFVDTTSPVVTGTPDRLPDNGIWYNHSLTITWTGTDNEPGGTGVASCNPPTLYTGADGLSLIVTGNCTDNMGNVGTGTVTINYDGTLPEITSLQQGQSFTLKQSGISPDFSCSDATSGIALCTSSVTILDTDIVGSNSYSITASDNAGNQVTQSVIYYVHYAYSGILQPINSDNSSIFKLGSTVTVKFQLMDANSSYVTNSVAKIYVTKIGDGIIGTEMEAKSTSNATTGNLFRYDSTSNQYIFNLGTKTLTTGTWQIRIELDDGTSKTVDIGLK